jgi:hypothetical protein
MSAWGNPNFYSGIYQAVKPKRQRGNDEGRTANGKKQIKRGGWQIGGEMRNQATFFENNSMRTANQPPETIA